MPYLASIFVALSFTINKVIPLKYQDNEFPHRAPGRNISTCCCLVNTNEVMHTKREVTMSDVGLAFKCTCSIKYQYLPRSAWNKLLLKMPITFLMAFFSCCSSGFLSFLQYASSSTRARSVSKNEQVQRQFLFTQGSI